MTTTTMMNTTKATTRPMTKVRSVDAASGWGESDVGASVPYKTMECRLAERDLNIEARCWKTNRLFNALAQCNRCPSRVGVSSILGSSETR